MLTAMSQTSIIILTVGIIVAGFAISIAAISAHSIGNKTDDGMWTGEDEDGGSK